MMPGEELMNKSILLSSTLSALLGLLLGFTAFGQTPEAFNPDTPWPATDALGRALPLELRALPTFTAGKRKALSLTGSWKSDPAFQSNQDRP
jgi:hypothetical protein